MAIKNFSMHVRAGETVAILGTTGSGKSELLQTLIASLALGHRPDELVLVLVDYKGGAAFGPCARLPHVVGTVTDLDGSLVERALASLGAELTRREEVLRAAGCADVVAQRRTAPPGGALPRLVLVVDEFASLAQELPDFVGGLVAMAVSRSGDEDLGSVSVASTISNNAAALPDTVPDTTPPTTMPSTIAEPVATALDEVGAARSDFAAFIGDLAGDQIKANDAQMVIADVDEALTLIADGQADEAQHLLDKLFDRLDKIKSDDLKEGATLRLGRLVEAIGLG